jgi:lipopolysaccharide biosynthesis glycosyltransferase
MTNKKVSVYYSVDDRYAPYLAVSMASLIDHTNPNRKYEINVVHQKLSKTNKERIKRLKTKNVKIRLVEMNKSLEEITNVSVYLSN